MAREAIVRCIVAVILVALVVTGCGGKTRGTKGLQDAGDAAVRGTGGSSGSGGAGTASGSSGGSGLSCPGTAGPTMVRVPAPDGTTYCIDSTEVTNGQYAEFLAAKGTDLSRQEARCTWKTTYVPATAVDQDSFIAAGSCKGLYDPVGRGQYPVVCVDWCDAHEYCKWAGKRMCGKIGGGANDYAAFKDATKSEWFNACSRGGMQAYPYGNDYRPTACNGYDNGVGTVVPVGSMATCEGSYPGLFDMNGNVWEWEDACIGLACRMRGASFSAGDFSVKCDSDNNGDLDIGFNWDGFRCCAD